MKPIVFFQELAKDYKSLEEIKDKIELIDKTAKSYGLTEYHQHFEKAIKEIEKGRDGIDHFVDKYFHEFLRYKAEAISEANDRKRKREKLQRQAAQEEEEEPEMSEEERQELADQKAKEKVEREKREAEDRYKRFFGKDEGGMLENIRSVMRRLVDIYIGNEQVLGSDFLYNGLDTFKDLVSVHLREAVVSLKVVEEDLME